MKNTLLRRALCCLTFIVISLSLPAQVQFRQGAWPEILAQAKAEKKLIFVDAYTSWCTWCKEMDKENFSDTIVGQFLNTHYLPLRLDMEEGMGLKMALKYRINAFPTFLIFNSDGQLVKRVMGYRKREQFLKELNYYLAPESHEVAAGVSPDWDLPYPDFYQKAFGKNGSRQTPDTSDVINWLNQQTDLFNELSWSVIWRFHSNEKYQQHFLDNIQKYYDLYGTVEVQDKLESIYYNKLTAAIRSKKEADFEGLMATIETYQRESVFEMKIQYQLFYYEKMENWKGFTDALEDFILQKGIPENTSLVNNHCWTLYENARDSTIIKTATDWMKTVTETEPTYIFLDTYAALLFKGKQYAEAERVAISAIETGKKENQTVRETELLLEKIKAATAEMNR